jgi:hypothetical protein
MSRTRKIPSYRLHKPTGQAVVRLDGRDLYLGKHGTEASHEAYRRDIAAWLDAGRIQRDATPQADQNPAAGLLFTVDNLILVFWRGFVAVHYRHADGSPTGEQGNFRDSLRPLRRLYGGTPARG